MKKARIFNFGHFAGILTADGNGQYTFKYDTAYRGPSISLTMPVSQQEFHYDRLPPFFDGLLPEGVLLEALLKKAKLDRDDYIDQLITVGNDLIGSITIEKCV